MPKIMFLNFNEYPCTYCGHVVNGNGISCPKCRTAITEATKDPRTNTKYRQYLEDKEQRIREDAQQSMEAALRAPQERAQAEWKRKCQERREQQWEARRRLRAEKQQRKEDNIKTVLSVLLLAALIIAVFVLEKHM